MAGQSQTKMIIITSDEDIIRQFALNKTKNTRIIDLDNNKQMTSITQNNNNIIDLDFLAELSQQNSSNDQVYKHVLESSDHKPSKSVKKSKKSNDFICTICGDHAIGFNYDVLSCASCKAFFRRNVNQLPGKIRCLTGQGRCSVTNETRRKCPKCRLDRCLAMGMRKDFIQSEQDKQQRKLRLEENRNITAKRSSTSNRLSTSESLSPSFDEIDRLLMDMDKVNDSIILHEGDDLNQFEDTLLNTLSVEDWVIIENVRSSFLSDFQDGIKHCSPLDLSDAASAFISWSKVSSEKVLCLINFFRQLDEFESLNDEDRFILIKYNLYPLFPISKYFHYNELKNSISDEKTEEGNKHCQFYMLCFGSDDIRKAFCYLVVSLVEATEKDPTILSLLLIILLFSQGLSMSGDEPPLKDSLTVNRAQSYYTQILWNYMVNKQGETKTWKQFTQLLRQIFRLQSESKRYREFFRDQITTLNTMDKIAPLMQTVLRIS